MHGIILDYWDHPLQLSTVRRPYRIKLWVDILDAGVFFFHELSHGQMLQNLRHLHQIKLRHWTYRRFDYAMRLRIDYRRANEMGQQKVRTRLVYLKHQKNEVTPQ